MRRRLVLFAVLLGALGGCASPCRRTCEDLKAQLPGEADHVNCSDPKWDAPETCNECLSRIGFEFGGIYPTQCAGY